MIYASEQQPRLRKMLIADDDPAILRLLGDRCAGMGFQVDTALNGVQLLVKERYNHPDIMIVDIEMPALNGLSICARLLELGREPLDVVVITGGDDDEETVERCDSLGAYFGRKGPDFWNSIEEALVEIYPDLADKTEALPTPRSGDAVPRRPRVLVIDNDPAFEKFLAGQLARYGIDTLYAPDVIRGCRMAGKEMPSAIIADNFISGGNAQSLLYRLRTAPETAVVPVVVISARQLSNADERDLRREISGSPGAVQVLRKSFDTDELFETLRKFCAFKKPSAPPSLSETASQ